MEIELLGLIADGHGHIETESTGEVKTLAYNDTITGHIFADEGEYAPEIVSEVVESRCTDEQPLLTARLGDIEYTLDSYAINLARHNEGRISINFEGAVVNTEIDVIDQN
jgi:hypothetical protein